MTETGAVVAVAMLLLVGLLLEVLGRELLSSSVSDEELDERTFTTASLFVLLWMDAKSHGAEEDDPDGPAEEEEAPPPGRLPFDRRLRVLLL